jgi:hypothetical protein
MMLPRSVIAYLCSIHTLRELEHIHIVVLDPNLAKPPSIVAESDVDSQNVFLGFHSNQSLPMALWSWVGRCISYGTHLAARNVFNSVANLLLFLPDPQKSVRLLFMACRPVTPKYGGDPIHAATPLLGAEHAHFSQAQPQNRRQQAKTKGVLYRLDGQSACVPSCVPQFALSFAIEGHRRSQRKRNPLI